MAICTECNRDWIDVQNMREVNATGLCVECNKKSNGEAGEGTAD
jgi:hypothetical protein